MILIPGFPVEVACNCGWVGKITPYDIGDGPEFCCPQCDWCYAPSAVVLGDGSTQATLNLEALAREHFPDSFGLAKPAD